MLISYEWGSAFLYCLNSISFDTVAQNKLLGKAKNIFLNFEYWKLFNLFLFFRVYNLIIFEEIIYQRKLRF